MYKVKRFTAESSAVDMSSEAWERVIARAKKNNDPRLELYEQKYQYTLEKEGETNPEKARKARERAKQGYSSSAVKKDSTGAYKANTQQQSFQNAGEQAKAYEEAARKAWKSSREDFNQKMRREYNSSFGKAAKSQAKVNAFGFAVLPTIAAGSAGWEAWKKRKKLKERRKEKETEKSYSEKKNHTARDITLLTGTMAGIGAGAGAFNTWDLGQKINNRVQNQNISEATSKIHFANQNRDKIPFSVQEEILKDADKTLEAGKRYEKRAKKVIRKAMVKNAGKGALIGSALSAPMAYSGYLDKKLRDKRRKRNEG